MFRAGAGALGMGTARVSVDSMLPCQPQDCVVVSKSL